MHFHALLGLRNFLHIHVCTSVHFLDLKQISNRSIHALLGLWNYVDIQIPPNLNEYSYTHLLLLISMLWHRQAIFESKGDKLSSSAEGRIRTQDLRYLFTSRLNACWQTDWAIEDQAKTWTRQPVPMISKHSAHSTLLPIGFRTWLWRYTYLLLLISMLWHRQAIFESKGTLYSGNYMELCTSQHTKRLVK